MIQKATARVARLSLLVAGLALAIVGCGSEPPNPDGRETVTGSITLNGSPLVGTAGIRFEPVDGGNGGGSAQLTEGSFVASGYDGLMPGKYIVRIVAVANFDKTTGELADNTVAFGNEVSVQVVPPEFNEKSTIEFEVVEGGDNVFNYDIKTDYKPAMPKSSSGKAEVPL